MRAAIWIAILLALPVASATVACCAQGEHFLWHLSGQRAFQMRIVVTEPTTFWANVTHVGVGGDMDDASFDQLVETSSGAEGFSYSFGGQADVADASVRVVTEKVTVRPVESVLELVLGPRPYAEAGSFTWLSPGVWLYRMAWGSSAPADETVVEATFDHSVSVSFVDLPVIYFDSRDTETAAAHVRTTRGIGAYVATGTMQFHVNDDFAGAYAYYHGSGVDYHQLDVETPEGHSSVEERYFLHSPPGDYKVTLTQASAGGFASVFQLVGADFPPMT